MGFLVEVAIAVIGVILGTAASESQMRGSEQRASNETRVHKVFQAVKDRYGITLNQIKNVLSKLDLRLNQLTDSTRGSARLSKASQIYRDFMKQYPDLVTKIHGIEDRINNAVNNLSAKEAQRASEVENRGTVTMSDMARDITPEADAVNIAIRDLNSSNGGDDVKSIDTGLSDVPDDKEFWAPKLVHSFGSEHFREVMNEHVKKN